MNHRWAHELTRPQDASNHLNHESAFSSTLCAGELGRERLLFDMMQQAQSKLDTDPAQALKYATQLAESPSLPSDFQIWAKEICIEALIRLREGESADDAAEKVCIAPIFYEA